jgi:hypothetical protein
MSSFGKNNKNIYSFKEGNNPLFPKSNKNINLFNYNNALRININSDIMKNNNKKLNSNISTNLLHKRFVENSPMNSKINILKYKQLDFPSNISDNKLIDIYGKSKSNKKQYLSSNKTNIDLIPYTTRNYFDIISSKNALGTSQKMINNKNNKYSLRKQNRKNKGIFDSNNNSYFNNINIIYNNSSTDINKIADNNLNTQKTNLNSNLKLKTDIKNIGLNSPKDAKIKLIFKNKNENNGKNSKLDLPMALKRKDSSLPLTYTNPGNNVKYSIDKKFFDSEKKLYLKRPKRNASNINCEPNLNLDNFVKEKMEINTKKNKKFKCPEDLHFYYILVIQEGKKDEKHMEKD